MEAAPDRQTRNGRPGSPGVRRRLYLVAIAAVAAVPILLFAAALAFSHANSERIALEERLWRTARGAALEIDKTLSAHTSALEAISAFIAPDSSAFAELRQGAPARLRNAYGWQRIRLIDARSMKAVDEIGAPGGREVMLAPELVQQVVRSGRPWAHAIPRQPERPLPAVVLRTPVFHEGRIDMVLAAWIESKLLGDVLRRVAPSAEWTLAAIDPAFRIGGRNRAEEEYIGTTVTPSLRERIEREVESFFYSLNKEGERVYTLFVRSELTGWTVAIGAPAAVVERPLLWSNVTVLAAGGGALAIAALLAFFLVGNYDRRQRAEEELQALAAEAAAERRISEIARNLPGVIYRRVLHPDGRVSYPFTSSGIEGLLGLDADALRRPMTLLQLGDILDSDAAESWHEGIRASARNLTHYKVEGAVRTPSGIRWLRSMAIPHRQDDGSIAWDGVLLDITEERRAEEQRLLLVAELDHRVRNILAVVSAIATASLPEGDAARTFRGRLRALAHAHGLLAETRWGGADLGRLLEAELAPWRPESGEARIALDGPSVTLTPSAAQSLALVVHELATNAAKHGALSTGIGAVSLAWCVEPRSDSPVLRLLWEESGGPAVAPPQRRGFGSKLIEQSITHGLGGTSELEFLSGGLRCTIIVPAAQNLVAGEGGGT